MREFLSTKEMARVLGLSEATVKRWCDKGKCPFIKTPGGHRRIPLGEALQFIHKEGLHFNNPEMLGLYSVSVNKKYDINSVVPITTECLIKGQEYKFKNIIMSLYLNGNSFADLADKVISPTFKVIGEKWECGDVEVYEERRAFEICLRSILLILNKLPAPQNNLPLAMGGSFSDDHYELPSLMVETSLRELGWNAKTLGSNLPVETISVAIERSKPDIFWLSVSYISDTVSFIKNINQLYETTCDNKALLVIGGDALTDRILSEINYTIYCKNMKDLITFINSSKGHLVFNNSNGDKIKDD